MFDLLLSWVAFPLVLAVLCTGCGLAVEALAGLRAPGALVPGVGFAAIVVVGQFLTLSGATAGLTTPVVVVLAAAGIGLGLVRRGPLRPPPVLILALAGIFAVYAAPIVLSGDATLAGFIKLDDTATWLAFTDQVMADGRDLDGLAPSTYEATLTVNIGDGYPVGVFLALGVGSEFLGDPAWLIQPYMAFVAVLLGLAAWSLATPLVASARVRGAVVFLAAQPALLFGYYLWGGIKEVAAATLIATAAAFAAFVVERPEDARRLLPLALACAAAIGVLSAGGAVWLAPILAVVLLALREHLPVGALAARAAAFVIGVGFLALPVLLVGGLVPPTSASLSDGDAKGNLFEPLDPLQAAGIWPAGDFRLAPNAEALSYPLIALAAVLAVVGAVRVWRRRAIGPLSLLAGGVVGCVALVLAGSPWVEGKALATASPIVLFAVLLGVVELAARTRPWTGLLAGLLVAGGVLWSNALAYREVNLAPREQLAELEAIGVAIAGEGPALITEYSPHGARHFLRDADPEAVSELRRRSIPRLNGEQVDKGYSADTDELDPAALGLYRTLVLRRSPARSRPPARYERVWSGDFYEAWQRPARVAELPPRLPLGSRYDPVAVPSCREVRALASRAGSLVAATGESPIVAGPPGTPAPRGAGSLTAEARVPRAGTYEVWMGGSVRPAVDLLVDGEHAGEARHQLNNFGGYVAFGQVQLGPGAHRVELRFAGADLHPGSGGAAFPVGPIALSRNGFEPRLVRVQAAEARELCGREWDWIEAG